MLKAGVMPHACLPRDRGDVPDLLEELGQLLVLHLEREALLTVGVAQTPQLSED